MLTLMTSYSNRFLLLMAPAGVPVSTNKGLFSGVKNILSAGGQSRGVVGQLRPQLVC